MVLPELAHAEHKQALQRAALLSRLEEEEAQQACAEAALQCYAQEEHARAQAVAEQLLKEEEDVAHALRAKQAAKRQKQA